MLISEHSIFNKWSQFPAYLSLQASKTAKMFFNTADLYYFYPHGKNEYDPGKPAAFGPVNDFNAAIGSPLSSHAYTDTISHTHLPTQSQSFVIESPGIKMDLNGKGREEMSKKVQIDLDQLTDQVYRMMEKKIRIERGRRGW